MKQKSLFLLCGVPGSGKSTWAAKQCKEASIYGLAVAYYSRDVIRYSLLKDGEEYFSHETEVFNTLCNKVQNAINGSDYDFIIVDATHLNERSRNKLLDRLTYDPNEINLIPVDFSLPLDICMSQNAQRTGRERVPDDAMVNMFHAYHAPTFNEKHHYDNIIKVYGEDA